MASFVTPRALRSQLFFGGVVAAFAAFAAGCTNTYDTQPAVAYYVAPPPTVAVATTAPAVGAAPGQEVAVAQTDYADTDPSALQEFHEPLAPYGTWINDPSYGTIWVPREDVVGADFVPYQTAGHWDYDDDYVWVSDYNWGWAPFHYGRWISLPNRGWAWIPGRTYSGAWVSWRTGPAGYGYVGWAPMAPSWYWFDGYAYGASVGFWYAPRYGYCNRDYLFSRNVGTHVVRGRDANVHDAHTSTYTPARPAADGRVAANPSVNEHTAANPSVNERTPASPSVDPKSGAGAAGRGAPNAFVRGPAPKALGIDDSRISRLSSADSAHIAKAHELATPASAVRVGAQPPTPTATTPRALSERSTVRTATALPRPGLSGIDVPAAMAPRYFVKPTGGGAPNQAVTSVAAVRSQPTAPQQVMPTQLPTAVATAPRTQGVEPRTFQAPTASIPQVSAPRMTSSSGMAPSEFAARAGQVQAAPSAAMRAPSYQQGSAAQVTRAPSYSTPSSSTFSRTAPSMGMSRAPTVSPARSYSAPSRPSAPSRSYSAPSRPTYSAPTRSYSAPSRSYSAPSAPSRSYSAPSRSYSAPSRSSSPSRSNAGSSSHTSSPRGRR